MPSMPTSATIPLPKVVFAKRKARSQVYNIATLDGRVRTVEIVVGFHCADWAEKGKAFLLEKEMQFLNEDGVQIMVAGERSAFPSTAVKRSAAEEAIILDKIYEDTEDESIQNEFEKVGKSAKDELIKWCIGVPVIGMIVVYAINAMKG